ncbi:PREDICTED: uncharacterized protein LOC104589115 [Nelumbo nucifera]|uniref:Uncharacterized protein n=2 Tax=Nelumbo nucifera TaxID=4432 RepID=A0A822ZD43_NELNU|nr:PREDICTED: uncharacterized protein LOC104589115 [Nelumbo nucifera]DAD41611.1 TPA_asm: hypothetical protein HUJ06_015934 [Nelumbo nucifera]
MATTTAKITPVDPNSSRVCFSFAAYAKNLIDHLKLCRIPVTEGLTDDEFSSIETSFGFIFPPDLRSILREGLPVGPGFPNWRLSSPQQLQILINLPILGICKEISKGTFWCQSWGDEPDYPNEALSLAKQIMRKAPILVPIYRHYYIPSMPNMAGNPVFFIQGGYFRCSGFDVAGFFQQVEIRQKDCVYRSLNSSPAWAAKAARRIEFWSDLVENVTCSKRDNTCRWRRGVPYRIFKEVSSRLREGGWTEEEVRDMMMTTEGDDGKEGGSSFLKDRHSLELHLRLLSFTLLRAGWRIHDVVYSLGFHEGGILDADSCLDVLITKAKQQLS